MFIKRIHLLELQNEEHVGFNTYVGNYITETGAAVLNEGDAKYAGFVTKLNNRIDQYSTAIAQRRGRAKKMTRPPQKLNNNL